MSALSDDFNRHCKPATICWNCDNAVPNAKGTNGCEWSLTLEPVPGWEAIPNKIISRYQGLDGKQHTRLLKSYTVIFCPRFKKG